MAATLQGSVRLWIFYGRRQVSFQSFRWPDPAGSSGCPRLRLPECWGDGEERGAGAVQEICPCDGVGQEAAAPGAAGQCTMPSHSLS